MTHAFAQEIADDFIEHLDEWYSLPETWDNELDTQISKWYANVPNVWPKRPYFSPSAATACPRELYYKAKRAPKDGFRKQPHQGRWTSIGTAIGDIIQRDILAMERNLEKKGSFAPRFRFERNEDGTPVFEDFAKRNVKVQHAGKTFYLYGTCDGIMKYVTEDGEVLRVGLEVKSKQTTAAKTSFYSMRNPEEKHVKQCITYSKMYDVDYYVILYVNAAHKSWVYDDADYEKSPDIRAFGIYITQDDRDEVFDRFATILHSVDKNEPMPLDLDNFTFNNYKSAIAKDLTDEELTELRRIKDRAQQSNLPAFKKRGYVEAIELLEKLRKDAEEAI